MTSENPKNLSGQLTAARGSHTHPSRRASGNAIRSLLHDLRNSHSALKLFLDFIQRHDSGHPEFKESVSDALKAHDRITRHINDIYEELERLGVLDDREPPGDGDS